MKICYVSDLHIDARGNQCYFLPVHIYAKDDVDALVIAGDISDKASESEKFLRDTLEEIKISDKPGMKLFFVPGNHEYWVFPMETAAELFIGIERDYCNFHYLSAHRNPVVFCDVGFVGDTLWTDYNLVGTVSHSMLLAHGHMYDFRSIWVDFYGGTNWTPKLARENCLDAISGLVDSISKLESMGNKIVVISHHGPTVQSIHEEYLSSSYEHLNPAYASGFLDENNPSYSPVLAKADYWIHGHVHHEVDKIVGKTRVLTNPHGLPCFGERENMEFTNFKYITV